MGCDIATCRNLSLTLSELLLLCDMAVVVKVVVVV